MKNTKAVIFDFDGTLYDFKGYTLNLLKQLKFSDKFLAAKERKVRSKLKGCHTDSKETFENLYFTEFSKVSKKSQIELKSWFYNTYLKALIACLKKNYSTRANTKELFTFLKETGIKTAVYSDYPFTKERMQATGLDPDSVDLIIDAQTLGSLKPSKENLLFISKKLGIKEEECLVVGDRKDTDGKGAELAGMQYIQIQTHKTKKNEDAILWSEFCQLIQAHCSQNK